MAAWIYKCNNRRHKDQVAYGDWSDFFADPEEWAWGNTKVLPTLAELSVGDQVIAYQTNRKELVGTAEVTTMKRNGRLVDVVLRPTEHIGVKVPPLKKADSRIAEIPAFKQGVIKTNYPISDSDARLLLHAARLSRSHSQSKAPGPARHWRMAMKAGSRGPSMWAQCFKLGIAAITYGPLADIDLTKQLRREPKSKWRQLKSSQAASLSRLAYEIRRGDVIYVKDGTTIVGRGIVIGAYHFDAQRILRDDDNRAWRHQLQVDWQSDFTPVQILLGSEPTTILELSGDRLRRLELAMRAAKNALDRETRIEAAEEGQRLTAVRTFLSRNRGLIAAKKATSSGRCEICGMCFQERYHDLKTDCLIIHHRDWLGGRAGISTTRIEDLHLICPNCHAAVHTENPPISPEKLRRRLRD